MKTLYCLKCGYIVSEMASECGQCGVKFDESKKYYSEECAMTAEQLINDMKESLRNMYAHVGLNKI